MQVLKSAPLALAISLSAEAAAETAYVSNEQDNTISVIDGKSLKRSRHHRGRTAAPWARPRSRRAQTLCGGRGR